MVSADHDEGPRGRRGQGQRNGGPGVRLRGRRDGSRHRRHPDDGGVVVERAQLDGVHRRKILRTGLPHRSYWIPGVLWQCDQTLSVSSPDFLKNGSQAAKFAVFGPLM